MHQTSSHTQLIVKGPPWVNPEKNFQFAHSLYSRAHYGSARRKIFKFEVLRCLENAILELFFEIEIIVRKFE